jgi:hypothetical protein
MRECLLIPILRFVTFLSAMHVLWPLLTETANPSQRGPQIADWV